MTKPTEPVERELRRILNKFDTMRYKNGKLEIVMTIEEAEKALLTWRNTYVERVCMEAQPKLKLIPEQGEEYSEALTPLYLW